MCMIRVGKMSCGLYKTLQMCTVKIESGLGYKSSQVQVSSLKSKSKSSKTRVLQVCSLTCNDCCPVSQSSSLLSRLEEFCDQHGVNLSSLKTVTKTLFHVLKSKTVSMLVSTVLAIAYCTGQTTTVILTMVRQ